MTLGLVEVLLPSVAVYFCHACEPDQGGARLYHPVASILLLQFCARQMLVRGCKVGLRYTPNQRLVQATNKMQSLVVPVFQTASNWFLFDCERVVYASCALRNPDTHVGYASLHCGSPALPCQVHELDFFGQLNLHESGCSSVAQAGWKLDLY